MQQSGSVITFQIIVHYRLLQGMDIFLCYTVYHFCLLMVSFAVKSFLSLIRAHLFILPLCIISPWETDLRKYCYNLCQRHFIYVPLLSFMVLMSYIWVFKPFWVYFAYIAWRMFYFHWFYIVLSVFPTSLVKRLLFLHWIFLLVM